MVVEETEERRSNERTILFENKIEDHALTLIEAKTVCAMALRRTNQAN